MVAARADAVSRRAARHRPGRRVRDLDERRRDRVRASPRRLLPRRRGGRAHRVHQRGRQSMATGGARAGVDDRGDHPARPSRRHRLPGGRAPRRPGVTRPPRAARLLRRVGDRHRAARRAGRATRSVPDEAHAHAVRHPRRRLPGAGFARRGSQRRLHPRRLDGAPHGPDVHRPGRRLAGPSRRPAARPAHLRGVRRGVAPDHRSRRPVHRTDERAPEVRRVAHADRRALVAEHDPARRHRRRGRAAQGPAGTRAPAARLGPARTGTAGRRLDRRGPPGHHPHRARTRTTALPNGRPGRRHARHPQQHDTGRPHDPRGRDDEHRRVRDLRRRPLRARRQPGPTEDAVGRSSSAARCWPFSRAGRRGRSRRRRG